MPTALQSTRSRSTEYQNTADCNTNSNAPNSNAPNSNAPNSNAPPLQLSQIGVRWNRGWGLENISMTLKEGQLCLLLGANGAGKTTLLQACCGLQKLALGQIRWRGELLSQAAARARQDIGWIAHEHRFYLELSAKENLSLLAGLYGLPPAVVAKSLKLLRLQAVATEPVANFSRGMIQRLALARLFLHQPRIWLLDEPFSNLDLAARTQFRDIIRHHLQIGGSVLITSHQPEIIQPLASQTIVLQDGRICHAKP